MTELNQSKEQDKPNPVSLREYYLMDRHERGVYMAKLTREEQKDLRVAAAVAMESKPRKERKQLADELVEKLRKRQNASIADKIEIALAQKNALALLLPERPAIFLRKLRAIPWPKWTERSSPYLIGAH